MTELWPYLLMAFAAGFGCVTAQIYFTRRQRAGIPAKVRCQACRRRYRPDESLACIPDAYCSEGCEVADLEKVLR